MGDPVQLSVCMSWSTPVASPLLSSPFLLFSYIFLAMTVSAGLWLVVAPCMHHTTQPQAEFLAQGCTPHADVCTCTHTDRRMDSNACCIQQFHLGSALTP